MNCDQENQCRYIVGIDLGTTNSAVSFVDTESKNPKIENFAVPQVTAPGEYANKDLFPSSHYEASEAEFNSGALNLPWDQNNKRVVMGHFARTHGAKVPGRLVVSAKSWLSHSGVDRTAALLPWHATEDVEKISPVEATARLLSHIRQAWNYEHQKFPLEEQDVIITVPASFDEVARELTVKAASDAKLNNIVLLEEPQAAFYSWISQHISDWHERVNAGQKILICDIGGGTTDFTLIEVRPQDGDISFHRVAVGDHLILGGDNQDLALAYHIERNLLHGKKLTPRQFTSLVRSCQFAKETLLSNNAPSQITVNIAGTGTSLIGGAIQTTLTKEEVEDVLVEGFFPHVGLDEVPVSRQSGFQEFGLPYAADAAVTRYLGSFLSSHAKANTGDTETGENLEAIRPDIILFNGGVFSSPLIQKRILDVLGSWFSKQDQSWSPLVLSNQRPELSVSRGASYFGIVRRGLGVRISAGLARSYYIGVETKAEDGVSLSALCLAPAGLQEGKSVDLSSRTFNLLIRQPVEFPLYVSSIRTTDQPGEIVEIDPLQMHALAPIRTVLRSGKSMEAKTVEVIVHVRLTEIGTLDLWCSEKGGNRSWRLQFDVRSATRTDIAEHSGAGEASGVIDIETVNLCLNEVISTFRTDSKRIGNADDLIKRVENICAIERSNWPPSFLRSLWEVLLENEKGRGTDPRYEARWLNMIGFSLRPGYGVAVDDWRVKQTWQIYRLGVLHGRNQACRAEWWILWRRIAGGLTSGQQRTLAQPLLSSLRSLFNDEKGAARRKRRGKGGDEKYGVHELSEIWRLLASLEHLEVSMKKELGDIALRLLNRKDSLASTAVWALGRLGARIPMYGNLNSLVDHDVVEKWIEKLIENAKPAFDLYFTLMLLSRKTGDRYRDIGEELRSRVAEFLVKNGAPQHYISLVKDGGRLDEEEQNLAFGEQLPRGLKIVG
ncbi:hsp70 family protein [Chitinispirillales bacterium ANBcel5]|uniref:Hsp70 family protein n=1 Tax=Cellulosispirillum alkaliphilum TaxID=3039283 RepID=UPI002A4F96FC|nr:hsp70 family protein [Chitinispirillales bacterium ANBcel5]